MSESFNRALRSAARRGRPAGVCPDAAMLAAYADNGLTADERRVVETHAADCATCLEHLALLGAVSLDRDAPQPARSWLVRWGWLVPVATAVLVVAVWVRLPEQKAAQDAPTAIEVAAAGDPKSSQRAFSCDGADQRNATWRSRRRRSSPPRSPSRPERLRPRRQSSNPTNWRRSSDGTLLDRRPQHHRPRRRRHHLPPRLRRTRRRGRTRPKARGWAAHRTRSPRLRP